MKSKINLIIIAGIIGLTSCSKEENQFESSAAKSTEIVKIESKTIVLDGIAYEANIMVDTETGEELELMEGKDADKIEYFFKVHSDYSTHINLDDDSVHYFSNEKKMNYFLNNSIVEVS